jgi:hypothetical protein
VNILVVRFEIWDLRLLHCKPLDINARFPQYTVSVKLRFSLLALPDVVVGTEAAEEEIFLEP